MLNDTSQTTEHAEDSAPAGESLRTEALHVLADVMRFKRSAGPCTHATCEACAQPHLDKILSAMRQRKPIVFALPAFPGKSPNAAKVLGHLPDMAERRALEFLQQLCTRVTEHYAPGARVLLCSDGRVFSDAVGMREEDVTAYQRELARLIKKLRLHTLSLVNLEDAYGGMSFDEMRTTLMNDFGEPLTEIQAAVRRGTHPTSTRAEADLNRLYRGLTRFLVEDAHAPGQTRSRSALQKECRERAYVVMQRSQAWSRWIEARFPHAVRLSIHPQACGAEKLGIRLLDGEQWLTPWHGVAVEVNEKFLLLKRAQAEQLGAELIQVDGRPSHYRLNGAQV